MTVYITQKVPGWDISHAKEFGPVEYLMGEGPLLQDTNQIYVINGKLKSFDDGDYLLLGGDPASIAVAASLAAFYNGGRYRLLRWDRQSNRYYELQVDLNGPMDDDEY